MLRRNFGKIATATIGAVLFPALVIKEHVDTHRLLLNFTREDDHPRFDLTKPYIVGEYAYASDGAVMARIDARDSESDLDDLLRPDFQGVWSQQKRIDDMVPFSFDPSLAVSGGWRCPHCLSPRVKAPDGMKIKYLEMHAEGIKPDTSFLVECDRRNYYWEDDTLISDECNLCRGGSEGNLGAYSIGDVTVDVKYAAILSKIPGIYVARQHGVPQREEDMRSIYFESEVGISGFVMPLRPYHLMRGFK